jgi:hypothetical protein
MKNIKFMRYKMYIFGVNNSKPNLHNLHKASFSDLPFYRARLWSKMTLTTPHRCSRLQSKKIGFFMKEPGHSGLQVHPQNIKIERSSSTVYFRRFWILKVWKQHGLFLVLFCCWCFYRQYRTGQESQLIYEYV